MFAHPGVSFHELGPASSKFRPSACRSLATCNRVCSTTRRVVIRASRRSRTIALSTLQPRNGRAPALRPSLLQRRRACTALYAMQTTKSPVTLPSYKPIGESAMVETKGWARAEMTNQEPGLWPFCRSLAHFAAVRVFRRSAASANRRSLCATNAARWSVSAHRNQGCRTLESTCRLEPDRIEQLLSRQQDVRMTHSTKATPMETARLERPASASLIDPHPAIPVQEPTRS
jgi:hypothetical protein